MHACDRHNVIQDSEDGVSVKRWMHCGRPCFSVLRFVGFKVDYRFNRCYEEIGYENDLRMLVQRYDGKPFPELGPWLIVLRSPLIQLYFPERFDYWERECDFKLRLLRHNREIFAGWHKVELFAILPSHRS